MGREGRLRSSWPVTRFGEDKVLATKENEAARAQRTGLVPAAYDRLPDPALIHPP